MSNFDDSESREWVIDNFPFDYLPNNTVEIVNRAYNDVIDLQGIDFKGNTTILIEVQVREQWGDLPYKDWTSKRYKDRSWGLTVEQRKWKGKNGRLGHFQLDKHIPLIYVVLNNTLNRCVFATRESILSGRTVNRFAGRYWGNEDFKHTNDYEEFEL